MSSSKEEKAILAKTRKKFRAATRVKPKKSGVRQPSPVPSPKMRLACRFYCLGYSQKESLKKAGLSEKSTTMFSEPQVLAYIDSWLENRYEVTADKVKAEIAKVAFSNLEDFMAEDPETGDMIFDLSQMTEKAAAAISEYSVDSYMEGRGEDGKKVKKMRVKLYDKLSALDKLSRIMGMYQDTVTVKTDEVALLQAGRARVAQKAREANEE